VTRSSQATAETWVLSGSARAATQKFNLRAFEIVPTEADSPFEAISHVHTLAPLRLNLRAESDNAVPLIRITRTNSIDDNTSNAKLLVLPRRKR
jgi:hypothetical protein